MKKLIFLILIGLYLQTEGQLRRVKLYCPSIKCLKTTEDGEDEIYMLVIWKTNTGKQGNLRLPATHIDVNDIKSLKNDINLGTLIDITLGRSEQLFVQYLLMEEDDGTPEAYAKVGEEFFREGAPFPSSGTKLEDFVSDVLERVQGTYKFNNSDDFIGGFQFNTSNNATWLETNFNVVYNKNQTDDREKDPKHFTSSFIQRDFTFHGDDSYYKVRVTMKSTDVLIRHRPAR